MLKYKIEEICTGLFKIKDPLDVNFYLIIGEEKALLFDTGYGIVDIPDIIKSITSKPLTVVLGHGHIDHANGACQFDEVYLREPDFELFHEHTSPQMRCVIIDRLNEAGLKPDFDTKKWIHEGDCKLKPLDVGTVLNLGSLNVEVIDMAAHTGGSIGLLIIEKRILLDSDSANSHCWMFVPQSLSIREYIAMLKRVKQLEFDTFFVAHQDHPHPKSDFDKYIRIAENATIKKSKKYNVYPEYDPYIYTEGDASIVFNKRTFSDK